MLGGAGLRRLALVSAILVLANATWARESDLVESPSRPTIAEVLAELQPWPEKNPFAAQLNPNHSPALPFANIEHNLANFIATIERLYPGATFAPLGRDVVMVGDAIDAFYTSIGQPGRVSRLNASGGSFTKTDPQTLTAFLRSAGLDFEKIADSPPFVAFDRSGFIRSGGSGQFAMIVQAGYDELIKQHGSQNAELIVSKFNGFAINGAAGPHLAAVTNGAEMDGLVQQQINYAKGGIAPQIIASLPNVFNGVLNDNGVDWHGPFGPFETRDGKFEGKLGALSSSSNRIYTLYTMYELISHVSDPAFLEKVRACARQLSYEFPTTRLFDSALKPVPFLIEDRAKEYQTIVSNLTVIGEEVTPQQKYFTPNAKDLKSWLDGNLHLAVKNEKGEELLILFSEGVLVAAAKNQITRKDTRRLIAHMLAILDDTTKGEPSEGFIEWIKNQQANDPVLSKLWSERAEYFTDEDPSRRGGAAVPKMFKHLSERMGVSIAAAAGNAKCAVQFDSIPDQWRDLFKGPTKKAD